MQSGGKKSKTGRRCTPNAPPRRAAPDTGAPVVNNYSPVRDVAADAVGIPYGELYFEAFGSAARTHELMPGGSVAARIDPAQTFAEREARRRNARWAKEGREGNEGERGCQNETQAGETG